jgi:hypothetical protein
LAHEKFIKKPMKLSFSVSVNTGFRSIKILLLLPC